MWPIICFVVVMTQYQTDGIPTKLYQEISSNGKNTAPQCNAIIPIDWFQNRHGNFQITKRQLCVIFFCDELSCCIRSMEEYCQRRLSWFNSTLCSPQLSSFSWTRALRQVFLVVCLFYGGILTAHIWQALHILTVQCVHFYCTCSSGFG